MSPSFVFGRGDNGECDYSRLLKNRTISTAANTPECFKQKFLEWWEEHLKTLLVPVVDTDAAEEANATQKPV